MAWFVLFHTAWNDTGVTLLHSSHYRKDSELWTCVCSRIEKEKKPGTYSLQKEVKSAIHSKKSDLQDQRIPLKQVIRHSLW